MTPPDPTLSPDQATPPGDLDPFEITLPPEERAMLEAAYAGVDVILEYGSGGSTFVALDKGAKAVFSVESDPDWAARIASVLAQRYPGRGVHVHPVDIGPTKAWGWPRNDRAWRRFHRYPLDVWDRADFRHPDVVLIDGRFRVACFLTVLLRATRDLVVLFDDYGGRPDYHFVETFARPVAMAGRMARFELRPQSLPREHLTQIIAHFQKAG